MTGRVEKTQAYGVVGRINAADLTFVFSVFKDFPHAKSSQCNVTENMCITELYFLIKTKPSGLHLPVTIREAELTLFPFTATLQ